MAPLSNRPRRKHPSSSLAFLIVLTVFISNSPLSKSRLSAFVVTSSPDEASLTSQPRRFVTFISPLTLLTDSSVHSQQLNIINVNFFTPCLLFSKVAFFLSPGPPQSSCIDLTVCSPFFPEKLRELWIIPIFFLLVTGVSLGVAWLLGNLFRLKPSQRYLLVLISQTDCLSFSQKLCNGRCHIHELEFPSGRPFAIPRCYRPRTQMGRRRHKGRYDRTCSHLLAPM
jgi:hypothetical protein